MKQIDANAVPWSLGDAGVKYLQQGRGYKWGIVKPKPGQSSEDYGLHIHPVVDETFYLMQGSPKFMIQDEEHRVQPGKAYVIEPHDKHNLINDTQEVYIAVFIKYPFDPSERHSIDKG